MRILVEIKDEDAKIVEKFIQSDMSKLIQNYITEFVEYMKNIALASQAGVELSADEVQKATRERIGSALQSAKKLSKKG